MFKRIAVFAAAALIALSASAVFAEGDFSQPSSGSEVNQEIREKDAPTAEEQAAYAARLGQATASPDESKLIEEGAKAAEEGTQEEFVKKHADEIAEMSEGSGGIAATAAPEDRIQRKADPVNIFVWCFVGAIVIGAVISFVVMTRKKKD